MNTFQFISSEGLYKDMELISEFDVRVVKKITTLTLRLPYTDCSSPSTSYEIIAYTKDGTELSAKQVTSLNNLDYFSLWPQIIDADLTKKQKTSLKTRLQQSAAEATDEQVLCATSSGIYKVTEKLLIYISGEQLITTDFSSYISMSFKKDLIGMGKWNAITDLPFETNIFLNDFMNVAPGASEIIFLSVLLGVIKPFFIEAGINPSFCINLYGRSGTYKTSLVKAMSFLGQREDLFVGSLINDRKDKILKAISAAYGRVYLLDDYHPSTNKQKRDRQLDLMDAAVRHVETNTHTAFVIMTSEFLDGCFSAQDRMFQILMKSTDLHLLSKIQSDRSYLPTIAYELVKQLLANLENVKSDIKTLYQKLDYTQESNTRTFKHGITLKVVARLTQKYLYNEDSGKMPLQKFDDAIDRQVKIQEEHMKHLRQLDSKRGTIEALHQILKSNIFQICSGYDNSYKAKFNQIYLKDNAFIYISKPALRYGLSQYFKCEFSSLQKITDMLSDEDLLSEDKDAKTKKFCGIRHFCISLHALEQYMQSITHTPDTVNQEENNVI